MNKCNHCSKDFSSKSALTTHQKTAKYCLDLQGKTIEDIETFICNFCDKEFTLKCVLIKHMERCKNKKYEDEKIKFEEEKTFEKQIEELKETIIDKDEKINELKIEIRDLKNNFENKIESKDEYISKLEAKIEKLENTIAKIAEKPTTTNNTTTNNNQKYQQIIQNLTPITEEHYIEIQDMLTEEHILNGIQGYIEATSHIFEDKAVCTDLSRKIIKYKDSQGNIITDPKMDRLILKIFKYLAEKNKELAQEYLKKLSDRCDELAKENMAKTISQAKFEYEYDKIDEQKDEIIANRNDIEEIAQGKDNNFKSKYVEKVCNKIYIK
jgi:plasmid stabilization system protein ParE